MDRNRIIDDDGTELDVALCEEGVDRNTPYRSDSQNHMSPSAKRAWIEIISFV